MHRDKEQKRLRAVLMKGLKYSLLGLTVYFVGKTLISQILQIQWSELTILTRFIFLSVLFEIAARLFIGLSYDFLLKSSGSSLPMPVSISVSWVSFMGKYLPGKVAVLASAVFLLKKYQIQTATAGIVPVFATIMTIFIALLISVPFLISGGDTQLLQMSYGLLPIFILAMLIFIYPRLFIKCIRVVFRRLGISESHIQFSSSYITICFGVILLQCICAGISTWMVIRSIYPLDLFLLPQIVSITALAGVIGLLAVFCPAGIGVRDGIYFFTLCGMVGSEPAALVTVLLRLIQTVTDIGTAGAGSVFLYSDRKKSEGKAHG